MTDTTIRMSADERRLAIIDAALHEFARGGLEGTTTDAIARRAGISQPYVIRLFGAKKALFLACVERQFELLLAAFTDAAEGLSGAEALGAMGAVYPQALLEQRHLVLMQLQIFAACDDDDVRDAVGAGMRRVHALIGGLSGAGPDTLRMFVATGILMSVATATGVPELLGGDDWRERSAEQCAASIARESSASS